MTIIINSIYCDIQHAPYPVSKISFCSYLEGKQLSPRVPYLGQFKDSKMEFSILDKECVCVCVCVVGPL